MGLCLPSATGLLGQLAIRPGSHCGQFSSSPGALHDSFQRKRQMSERRCGHEATHVSQRALYRPGAPSSQLETPLVWIRVESDGVTAGGP